MKDPGEKIQKMAYVLLVFGLIVSFIMLCYGLFGNWDYNAFGRGVQIGSALTYGMLSVVSFFIIYGFGTIVDNSEILVTLKLEEMKAKKAEERAEGK
jgi:amino acid permease